MKASAFSLPTWRRTAIALGALALLSVAANVALATTAARLALYQDLAKRAVPDDPCAQTMAVGIAVIWETFQDRARDSYRDAGLPFPPQTKQRLEDLPPKLLAELEWAMTIAIKATDREVDAYHACNKPAKK